MAKLVGPFTMQEGHLLRDANGLVVGTIGSGPMARQIVAALNDWWEAIGQFDGDDEDDPTQEQEIRI